MSKQREALEAARDFLVNIVFDGDLLDKITNALAEPEQEPVERQFKDLKTGKWCNFIDEKHYKDTLESGLFEIRSLYTSPKPREWQELSEHDIEAICAKADKALSRDINLSWRKALITLTSAALRAKNGG